MPEPDVRAIRRFLIVSITFSAAVVVALVNMFLPAAAAGTPRINLKVLVVTDGGPAVAAIVDQLESEGVPFQTVDLTSSCRPTITSNLLAGTVTASGMSTPVANYQAVVLPNASPAELSDAERTALTECQAAYNIRGVYAYTYASPAVGLNAAVGSGYAGTLDGRTRTVTSEGKARGFGYSLPSPRW